MASDLDRAIRARLDEADRGGLSTLLAYALRDVLDECQRVEAHRDARALAIVGNFRHTIATCLGVAGETEGVMPRTRRPSPHQTAAATSDPT